MTSLQKEHVRRMRGEGMSYSKIAASLGLSENTIKSYCKRNNLGGVTVLPTVLQLNTEKEVSDFCKNCGQPLEQRPGMKLRKFCSDKCRTTWWNGHLDQVSQTSIYHLECAACGKHFDSYGNKTRKYCSHACYIKDRFSKRSQTEVGELI